MKLGNYFILCTDQKSLQNKSIKVFSTLLKTWRQFLRTAKTVKQVNHTNLNYMAKKNMALVNLSICDTWKNTESEQQQ